MTTIRMSVNEFPNYVEALGLRAMPEVVNGLYRGAMRALPLVREAGTRAPPASPNGSIGAFNLGAYRRGWHVEKLPDEGARLFNTEPYAAVIEWGRRPGAKAPPAAVLAQWARRKGLLIGDEADLGAALLGYRRLGLSRRNARAAVKRSVDRSYEALGFKISRAIKQRGLAPRLVLTNAMPMVIDVVKAEVIAQLRTAVERTR